MSYKEKDSQTNDDSHYNNVFDLVSRIHAYFIHGYDINRLSYDEMKQIDYELENYKQVAFRGISLDVNDEEKLNI